MTSKSNKQLVVESLLLPIDFLIINSGYPTKLLQTAILDMTEKNFLIGAATIVGIALLALAGVISIITLVVRLYSKMLVKLYFHKRKNEK